MKTDVIFAGFADQGVCLIGELLSQAAQMEGKEATLLASEAAETDGPTTYVTVIIANQPIGAPEVSTPVAAAVMSPPALAKLGPAIVPGGQLIIDESRVSARCDRQDIDVMALPADELASSVEAEGAANIVMLGAYLALTNVVDPDAVGARLRAHLAHEPDDVGAHQKALQLGFAVARQHLLKRGTSPPGKTAGTPLPGTRAQES